MQLPGFGLLTVMTILGGVGTITRFDTAKRLVGYAGLDASVHDSGQTPVERAHRQGERVLLKFGLTPFAKLPIDNCISSVGGI